MSSWGLLRNARLAFITAPEPSPTLRSDPHPHDLAIGAGAWLLSIVLADWMRRVGHRDLRHVPCELSR
ncbi:hypothetical protein GCM10010404_70440 [Nonomuraea africana]|uniref:Uncharacterized protein n=1 Tax=Nonomuraea africana TaxID=46171 RepID=A0ABR9KQZ8_9ACTN|nr:hypothetical protein [Nonomuraea africana]MBE1563952.1 hypothetical protein [Nonomuraea africana]